MLKKSLPDNLFRPCPYREVRAYNVTMDPNLLTSKFLTGNYRVIVKFFDEVDANMITMIEELEFVVLNTRNQNGRYFLNFLLSYN